MVGFWIRAGAKGLNAIKGMRANVPKTGLEKAKSKLALAKQKAKASGAKLKQTIFEISQKNK